MRKKKILICGASGFIGYNLFQTLSQREDLDIYGTYLTNGHGRIENPGPPRLIRCDLTEKESVKTIIDEKIDVLIQCAATTSGSKDILKSPEIHITDNAIMNSLIFRRAFQCMTPHIIFLSCTVMYLPGHYPRKETDIDLNIELGKYFGAGWTKVYLEKMCEFYSRQGFNRYTVVRHSNVYGPHDKFDLEHSHVFGATVAKAMNSKNREVKVWGAGKERRDLLHIDDLIRFIEGAIDQLTPLERGGKCEIFNVGVGETVSVNDLVGKVIQASEKDLRIVHDLAAPTIDSSITIDTKKAKEVLGWEPKVSLDEGIRKTIEWYRKHYAT